MKREATQQRTNRAGGRNKKYNVHEENVKGRSEFSVVAEGLDREEGRHKVSEKFSWGVDEETENDKVEEE